MTQSLNREIEFHAFDGVGVRKNTQALRWAYIMPDTALKSS